MNELFWGVVGGLVFFLAEPLGRYDDRKQEAHMVIYWITFVMYK